MLTSSSEVNDELLFVTELFSVPQIILYRTFFFETSQMSTTMTNVFVIANAKKRIVEYIQTKEITETRCLRQSV